MGTKQSKEENIVIEAAGTGTNTANQEVPGLTKTDWLLGVVIICLLIGFTLFVAHKCKTGMKKLIRKEIYRIELGRSQADVSRTSANPLP